MKNWIHKIKVPIDVYSVCAALNGIIARHASLRSDFNEPPPLRAFLQRIADDESMPAIALHHTVVDSHRLDISTQEFVQFHLGAKTGGQRETSPLGLHMGDYYRSLPTAALMAPTAPTR